MTRNIGTASVISAVRLASQGSDISTPASGYGAIYNKNGELYFINNSGTVFGPLFTGEGARAYNSGNISVPNNASTDLTFDSERYDTNSIHSTVTNTGRLTCQTAGKYVITGSIAWDTNTTGIRSMGVYLNNTTWLTLANQSPIAGDNTRMSVSTIYTLAAADYVTLRVYQNSGGALNVIAAGNFSPEFSMQRIG